MDKSGNKHDDAGVGEAEGRPLFQDLVGFTPQEMAYLESKLGLVSDDDFHSLDPKDIPQDMEPPLKRNKLIAIAKYVYLLGYSIDSGTIILHINRVVKKGVPASTNPNGPLASPEEDIL